MKGNVQEVGEWEWGRILVILYLDLLIFKGLFAFTHCSSGETSRYLYVKNLKPYGCYLPRIMWGIRGGEILGEDTKIE